MPAFDGIPNSSKNICCGRAECLYAVGLLGARWRLTALPSRSRNFFFVLYVSAAGVC